MDSERGVDEELAALLKWEDRPRNLLSWTEAEGVVGIRFPDDFKKLMTRFPSGVFATYFHIYSPVQSKDSLAEFRIQWADHLNTLNECREHRTEAIEYSIYPEPHGLIPWAGSEGHIFYWKTDEINHPDTWQVVFSDGSASDWGEYGGTASEFMLNYIAGYFSHPALYYGLEKDDRNFVPFSKFLT